MSAQNTARHGPLIELKSADITPAMAQAGVSVLRAHYGTRTDQNDENIAGDVFLAMFAALNEAT